MKIISLNITEFGGLRDFKLDFSDGLNIIKGNNESGKSTVSLFIIYMLYGLPSKKRANTPYEYDKDRSLSWDNSKAEGSIIIEDGGKTYRIERKTKRKGGSGSDAEMTDLDTGKIEYRGDKLGESLFGVSRETFASCLWCGQTGASSISGNEISDALSNLSLTADESVNADKILKTIREYRKRYRYEKGEGGLITETENKIGALKARKTDIEKRISENESILAERENTNKKINDAENRLLIADKRRKAAPKIKLLSRFEMIAEYERELESYQKKLDDIKTDYGFPEEPTAVSSAKLDLIYGDLKNKRAEYRESCKKRDLRSSDIDENAVKTAEKITLLGGKDAFCGRIRSDLSSIRKKRVFSLVLLCISLLALLLGIILLTNAAAAAIISSFSVCTVSAFGAFFAYYGAVKKKKSAVSELASINTGTESYEQFIEYCFSEKASYEKIKAENERVEAEVKNAKKNLEDALNEADNALAQYGRASKASCEDELAVLIEDIRSYLEKEKTILGNITRISVLLSKEKEDLKNFDEEVIKAELLQEKIDGFPMNDGEIEAEYRTALKERDALKDTLSKLNVKLNSATELADKLADLQGEIETLEEQKKDFEKKFRILDKAFSAVSEASENMHRVFAPKIRERTGERLSEISGGKYSQIFLSDKMSVEVEISGTGRSAQALSGGTTDAVYIALRLSLTEYIFDKKVPFFMDETLAHLDDIRASNALSMLNEYISEGNQGVLFTCHRREAELCGKLGIKYNLIEI
ncbi:MAG: AAA family ATPase [Clostridia bacterium]|nr:AAA family ATPase [Clostridia bacterium]